jgi:hypothetical protein
MKREILSLHITERIRSLAEWLRIFWLIPCFFFAIYFSQLVARIPFSAGFSYRVHINLLVFITFTLSLLMIAKLCTKPISRRTTRYILAAVIVLLSLVFYMSAIKTTQGVQYPGIRSFISTFTVCMLAIIPFFGENRFIGFSENRPEIDSIFFATSILWIAPLISELVRWQLLFSGWILGGDGFNDFLFFWGFVSLISLVVYHGSVKTFDILYSYFNNRLYKGNIYT